MQITAPEKRNGGRQRTVAALNSKQSLVNKSICDSFGRRWSDGKGREDWTSFVWDELQPCVHMKSHRITVLPGHPCERTTKSNGKHNSLHLGLWSSLEIACLDMFSFVAIPVSTSCCLLVEEGQLPEPNPETAFANPGPNSNPSRTQKQHLSPSRNQCQDLSQSRSQCQHFQGNNFHFPNCWWIYGDQPESFQLAKLLWGNGRLCWFEMRMPVASSPEWQSLLASVPECFPQISPSGSRARLCWRRSHWGGASVSIGCAFPFMFLVWALEGGWLRPARKGRACNSLCSHIIPECQGDQFWEAWAYSTVRMFAALHNSDMSLGGAWREDSGKTRFKLS